MRLAVLLFTLPGWVAMASDAGDWPQWRGPDWNGIARGDAPLHWSDREHIKWKAEISGRGFSSPVVWGDKIFVTTSVPTPTGQTEAEPAGSRRFGFGSRGPQPEQKFVLMCLDRKTGKLLWERVAKVATPHEGYHPQYGSFASNSPVTDGKHVIAFFGSRGVYCYDLDGKKIWEKDFGLQLRMFNGFGEGSWPTLEGNTLLLLFDHEGESFLAALDKSTGRELWRVARPDGNTNWSGPVVISYAGKKQIIVSASRKVHAYDFETGKPLWECAGLGQNTIPAPVTDGSLVFVMSGFRNPNLLAIRLGRNGDLTGTDAVVWQNQRGNSYTASPVLSDGKLYVLTDSGMLSCFDAKTGKAYYQQQRLGKPYNFKASPVAAGGKLYLASEEGDVIVVNMGEKFEVVATNTLENQTFIGSPAIVDGEIYLRGQNALFCIR
ncbi:MAG TPA: PQQ-binding-like beta-propeller repeat protein [Bryobacteraceae bacterium]|nr:PQQ-binding-like beta-propeller repeat protein [Bryobacteraceae bacterium]